MFRNKKGGLLLLGLLLIFTLFGCQNDESDSSENEGSEDGVVELTLWNTWTDEAAESEAAKNRVQAFNESQDDIKITLETTTHDQYKTKLKTQAAGKQLPELIQVWPGSELEPIATGDVLMPIDSIKDHWDGLIEESVMADYAYEGTQYAIPGTMSYTSLIYYDKDILAEAGYEEFPETYEDLTNLITSLKDRDVTPIQLGNKGQWVLQSVYISTIADRLTGSDYLQNVLDGNAKFTDEQFIDGLSVIQELYEMKAFNEDMNTLDEFQARDNFTQGNGAMYFGGSWNVGPLLESAPEDMNIGVARFPSVSGGEGDPNKVSGVSSVGIGLNSQLTEEQKEAGVEFLKFFFSEELYTEWVKDGLMVAAVIEIPSDIDGLTKQVIEATNDGTAPVYDGVLSPGITSILNNGLQAITTGSKTPEQLAEEMQNELENQ